MIDVRKIFLAVTIVVCSATANAQAWVDLMNNDTANFYDVQNAFNSYWSTRPIVKGKGYKVYKRWEWFNEQRTFPTGNRIPADQTYVNFKAFKDSYTDLRSTNGNWVSLGASSVPTSGGGAGRVSCVRFDPTNSNNVFAGTPAGGLWKSTNGGTTWAILGTEDLQSMGVYDVAIDPTNTNIIYIATGDIDAGDTRSIGILKSTDAGATWNPTGLSYLTSANKQIARILINPTNPQILLAATNNGIYRTTDGGVNWTSTLSGTFRDMEFKPGNPNTVYVCGTSFKYSNDGGITWTSSTAVFTLINRMSMAVTAANDAYVYLLASNSGDNGFHSLLRSTDSGVSFTTMSSAAASDPNILGWSSTGSDAGGQGWYDLAIAASPTNANTIFTGGVNIWKSTNGGASFSFNSDWTGWAQDYVHADIHDLQFANSSGTTLYAGCDGGVFKSTNTGTDWDDFSNTLCIGQIYRLGVSQTSAAKTITGWQDNGTNYNSAAGTWSQVLGGDGMECIISHSSSSTMYGSLYYGEIHKSTTSGGSWSTIVNSGGTGLDENGNWITPYIMWAGNSAHLFVGKHQVYKSTNSGSSFTQVGTFPTGSLLNCLAVAPSNENYIYASRANQLYVSTDGSTWNLRPVGSTTSAITNIAVSNADPKKAWVTFSGYVSGEKIYQTTDAGLTWTNISSNLPNIPANCVAFTNSSSDALYVGMDVGVYYKDASMTNWILFNTGLPNTIIDELEIQYSTSKLRAATYGRGLWESDLFTAPTTAPVASFSSDITTTCSGLPVQFTDLSTNIPTGWLWTFGPSATPSTSTLQNPTVVFNTAGTYNITLAATNAFGTGTTTTTAMINVLPQISGNVVTADQLYCVTTVGDTLEGTLPTGATGVFTYQWSRSYSSPVSGFVNITTGTGLNHLPGTINQDIWFRREVNSSNCKDTSNVIFIDFVTLPPVIITNTAGTLTTPDNGYTYQWYLDGVIIPGATDTFFVALTNGSYTCVATDTNGCTRTSPAYVFTGINNLISQTDFNYWPNPANDKLNVEFKTNAEHKILLINSLSQVVYSGIANGSTIQTIPLTNLTQGVYFLKVDSGNGISTSKLIIEKN